MDQDTRVDGVFVPFFGRPAHTAVGPARLAASTRAPVLTIRTERLPEGVGASPADARHLIEVGPPLPLRFTRDRDADVLHNTGLMNAFLEEAIRREPTQWVWMHRRWKTQPEAPK